MSNSRKLARGMAQMILSVAFLGSGISFLLWVNGNRDTAGQVCLGFGVVALLVLLIGSYIVAKAKAAEVE